MTAGVFYEKTLTIMLTKMVVIRDEHNLDLQDQDHGLIFIFQGPIFSVIFDHHDQLHFEMPYIVGSSRPIHMLL